jgi:hypothetical protein
LLFLSAIVLAGWPIFVIFAHTQEPEQPPPPTVPASTLKPVHPDEGIEFQALVDKAPIQTRESAAYATLLERVRDTPAAELAKQARRDIFWTHLWEVPKHYRGVPIHLEGTAKKILTHEVSPAMSPSGRLYEVWLYSDENRAFPYVVTIEDPPTGLVIGHELNLRVTVDGYFMKLLGYHAGDHLRAAPMLVGRMHWTPAPAAAASPIIDLNRFSRQNVVIIVFVMLAGYLTVRVIFQVRKALAPTRTINSAGSFSEGLPPEEVADWLQNLPDALPESEEDVPPLREGPGLRD